MTGVANGHKFCGRCGAPVPEDVISAQTRYFSDMQNPDKARLILIRGDGMDGLSYHLKAEQHILADAFLDLLSLNVAQLAAIEHVAALELIPCVLAAAGGAQFRDAQGVERGGLSFRILVGKCICQCNGRNQCDQGGQRFRDHGVSKGCHCFRGC